ncbi:MAG: GNAT family N-acetyltransferase [Candidatus Thorarchaeota archaeon]
MEKMLLDVSSKIETKRLIIRRYKKGDGKSFLHLLETNDNREYLKDHIDEASTVRTQEEAEIRIRQFIAFWVGRERFVLGIWLKSSYTYIGQLWIEPKKWEVPSFELGWFLERTHQGKGLATEAVKHIVDYIFNELKAHRIIVFTGDNNERSMKLAERCGFFKEGHFRDHEVKDGKRFGLYCYALLKHEYFPNT